MPIPGPRTRSPSYPAYGLEDSIRRAEDLHKQAHGHKVAVETVAEAWGTNTKSSSFLQAIAALLQFGLLEDEGRSESRRLWISELGQDILIREHDSPERIAAIKKAALNPKLHRELWEKYNGRLPPSDSAIRVYLLREREDPKFHPAHVDGFIGQFRSTIAFAGLTEFDKVPHDEAESSDSSTALEHAGNPRPIPRAPSRRMEEVTDGEQSKASRLPQREPSMTTTKSANFKEDVFTLEEGQVIIQWPEQLSQESFDDFESWLQLVIRKVKRSVKTELPEHENN